MKTHIGSNLLQFLLGLGLMAMVAGSSQAQIQTFKLTAETPAIFDRFGSSAALSGNIALVGHADADENGEESGSAYLFNATTGQQLFRLLPTDGAADDRFGGSAAISGNISVVGADGDDNENGAEAGSAYVFDTTTGQRLFKLLPADGAAGDGFGTSVAISGNIALIGSPGDADNGGFSGSAYLFDVTTGQQLFKLLPADGASGDGFGLSVSISGNLAVVAAENDGDNGEFSGSAYLFDVTTGQQLFKLLPDDGAAYDFFGSSVAISGNTVLVGAPFDQDYGFLSGSVYVFSATTGQQLFKLNPADAEPEDGFGRPVAISGNVALIGAPLSDDFGPQTGSVYLFDVTTGQQLAKIVPADGEYGDLFGRDLAIDGNRALITSPLARLGTFPNTIAQAGAAYVFELPEFKSETLKLVAEDYAQQDSFGGSVALSGDNALIGAIFDADNGINSGSAYLFDANTGEQLLKLLPNDGAAHNFFGHSAALSGPTALVGAPADDDNGYQSGSAYVFDATTGQQLFKLLASDGANRDFFGGTAAISGNLAVIGATGDGDNGDYSGAAYLFDVSTGQQLFKLLPTDGEADDSFGASLAISGNTAIVGAPIKANLSGAAYLFDVSTGQQLFKLLPNDIAAEDFFGSSVAIDGNFAVVGAQGHDGEGGDRSGAAYLFDITTGQQIAKLQPQDAEEYGTFGEGVAISGNTVVVGAIASGAPFPLASQLASAYVFDVPTGRQLAKLVHSDREQNDGFGWVIAVDGNTALFGASSHSQGEASLAGSAYVFQNLRPLPPTIVAEPEDQTLNEGEDATFGVMTEGTKPFHYQWLHNGSEITGATNTELVLTSVQKSDEGLYSVIISNEVGSVTSAPAMLSVNQFPIADASATKLFWTSPNGIDANVVLDGSRSSDPDGDPLTHVWFTASSPIATGMVQVVTLPVGIHAVDLEVDDGLAQDTDSITVSVLTAGQSVERLQSLVGESDLTDTQPMLSSLNAALVSIDRGSLKSAVNQLHAFQNKLRAQVAPFDPVLAAELAQVAAQVIDALGGDGSLRGAGKIRSLNRPASGGTLLRIEAAAGYVYIVEASCDLVDWEAVGTTTLQPDGTFEFDDAQAANLPCRFYRIVTP